MSAEEEYEAEKVWEVQRELPCCQGEAGGCPLPLAALGGRLYCFPIRGQLPNNAVMAFDIPQCESAMGIPVSPPSWISFPPPTPSHPSRLSQSTRCEFPASFSKFPLLICFTYGNVYVSMLLSQISPPSPSQRMSLDSLWSHLTLGIPKSRWARDSAFQLCLPRPTSGLLHLFLPLQYSCLENPMDGGAWWAASPWGR